MSAPFAFIGVPIDSVGRSGGTEHGPAALREAGLAAALGGVDAGDLPLRIRGEERDPETGIVGSPDVLSVTTELRRAVAASIGRGERPFLAGGCCAELPGALAGARDALGRVGLAYLDGHLDLYDGVTSPTGEAADMPISVILGRGPAAWVAAADGPSADAADIAILGYRDLEESQTYGMIHPGALEPSPLHLDADGVRTEGPGAVGARVAERLAAATGAFWLHLDVDVLDQDVFPSTDYLMPGGLTWEELVALMGPPMRSSALVGASLGCYNPDKDPGGQHGRALVEAWRQAIDDPEVQR